MMTTSSKKRSVGDAYRRSRAVSTEVGNKREMGDLNEVRLLQTYIDSLKR